MIKVKGIILDLDQTLVDSSIAQQARDKRDWQRVYSLIPSFKLYGGWENVFSEIRKLDIKCCLVTNSPSVYAQKVVKYFNIPCDFIVGYHDVIRRKPSPEPMLLALKKLEINASEVISLGDRAMDVLSSNSAKIFSIACLWDSPEKNELINSKPMRILNNPIELLNLFSS